MTRFYVKIPKNFVRLILQDEFWIVYISFVRIVKNSISCTVSSGSPCPPSRVLLLLLLLLLFLESFHTSISWCFFYCSLNDSKSYHVSRIFFNILADLNIAVVWMASILFLISDYDSFSPSSLGQFQVLHIWLYHSHSRVPQRFQVSGKVQVFVYLFLFFHFNPHCLPWRQNQLD